jgi:hypothetical protein
MSPAIKIADGSTSIASSGSGCASSWRQHRPDRTRSPHVIAGDAEQPQLRRCPSWAIAPRAVDNGNKCLVNDVLGCGVRAAHVRGKPADVGVMTAVELGEGIAIAFGNLSDQQVVG